jgi:hypothetical protein
MANQLMPAAARLTATVLLAMGVCLLYSNKSGNTAELLQTSLSQTGQGRLQVHWVRYLYYYCAHRV